MRKEGWGWGEEKELRRREGWGWGEDKVRVKEKRREG